MHFVAAAPARWRRNRKAHNQRYRSRVRGRNADLLEHQVNRRSLLTSALLALAAGRLPLSGLDRPREAQDTAREKVWRHGLSLFGDLKYPRRLQAFRLRQRRCAERRHGAADRARHLRQFQLGGRRRQRHPRRRHRSHLRHAADAGARRSIERIWAARRGRELSGRFLLGHLPAARRSEMARRQAGHAGRRDLLLRCVQEIQSAALPPIIATSSRPRKPASARSPSPSTAPATANCRRSSASSRPAQALVGRHRQERQQARHRRHHARAAARQRRLPHQGILARPQHRL